MGKLKRQITYYILREKIVVNIHNFYRIHNVVYSSMLRIMFSFGISVQVPNGMDDAHDSTASSERLSLRPLPHYRRQPNDTSFYFNQINISVFSTEVHAFSDYEWAGC